jgi:hypothetical protein
MAELYAYPAMQMELQICPKQNNKRDIQLDFQVLLAPIHKISYKFILPTFQGFTKSHVHVYYIVYRITQAVRKIKHYVRYHFRITAKHYARDYFSQLS